ncbi:MAG: ABC transporter ATP-binding protein [Clostridiaceae bacterium]|nr:ABC transporter ATP-binding protein [Clostridiaceae bacterium]
MMKNNIIEIKDVSMMFKLTNDRISSLKEYVTSALSGKLSYKEFWALNNISINIKKGEVIGIIGRNGSGKSTLLKIISGIMKPTKGSITCNSNIVPMLELGSGFDFDLTGKENIYLNGAILGYSKKFLDAKYEEILEFSEIGDFINVPIRNYSSGMMMRLAFSIATVVNPEILIVDEILSVGDEAFQQKSHKRMRELMSGGTTVLFVSHSLDQIREMCNRVVWLERGEIRMIGNTDEVCDKYVL